MDSIQTTTITKRTETEMDFMFFSVPFVDKKAIQLRKSYADLDQGLKRLDGQPV